MKSDTNKETKITCHKGWSLFIFASCPKAAEWKVVLLFVPADLLWTCSPNVSPLPTAKSYLMCHVFERGERFSSCVFVPQMAAQVEAVGQGVGETLQHLQEKVMRCLSDLAIVS